MKEESRSPMSPRYSAILNAANYISTVLADWADNLFFLQLQQAVVSLAEEEEDGRPVLSPMEAGRLASLEGSLFESLLALLNRLRGDMIGRLLDTVMRDVREKAQLYRQDRWLSLPSQCDQATMSLSSAARRCIVLNLNVGSALLLRDLLRESREERISLDKERLGGAGGGEAEGDGCRPSPEQALNELGVYRLAPGDVLILLNLRASWPGQ
ncbi:hypothetical protein CRUP_020630 [Coryphaenoides rupestris]|nr:hypothetical protein CRUP_020630 [Coryphaenoides rupestris]